MLAPSGCPQIRNRSFPPTSAPGNLVPRDRHQEAEMAYNETRVTICGNVASAVSHTKVGTGFSRAKFRLYSAERVWDSEQRTWEDGARMFLTVSCWRMLADNAHMSLNKGDPVVVSGRMTIRDVEYE